MPAAKPIERARARELRASGWSLRRIAAELDVSLSSASLWVRDMPSLPKRRAAGTWPEPRLDALGPSDEGPVPIRTCSRCKRELRASAFNRHRGGRQWWCQDCFKAYYREDRERHRTRNNALKRRRVDEARAFIAAYLSDHPCVDCKESAPVVLEFDHVSHKRAEVSVLVSRGVRLPSLEQEILRCEVVCANCHRRRTATRSVWRRALDDPDAQAWRSPRHRRNVLFALDALESGCVECGLRDLTVLDFDHVHGKTSSVLRLAYEEASLDLLAAEIRRCEIRCANCHRRRTADDRGYYRASA